MTDEVEIKLMSKSVCELLMKTQEDFNDLMQTFINVIDGTDAGYIDSIIKALEDLKKETTNNGPKGMDPHQMTNLLNVINCFIFIVNSATTIKKEEPRIIV